MEEKPQLEEDPRCNWVTWKGEEPKCCGSRVDVLKSNRAGVREDWSGGKAAMASVAQTQLALRLWFQTLSICNSRAPYGRWHQYQTLVPALLRVQHKDEKKGGLWGLEPRAGYGPVQQQQVSMEAMSECSSGETVMSGLKPHRPCTAQRCFLLLSRRASLCGHAVTQSQSRCVQMEKSKKLIVVSLSTELACFCRVLEWQIAGTDAKSSNGLRYFQDGHSIATRVSLRAGAGRAVDSRGGEESRQVSHPMLELTWVWESWAGWFYFTCGLFSSYNFTLP